MKNLKSLVLSIGLISCTRQPEPAITPTQTKVQKIIWSDHNTGKNTENTLYKPSIQTIYNTPNDTIDYINKRARELNCLNPNTKITTTEPKLGYSKSKDYYETTAITTCD